MSYGITFGWHSGRTLTYGVYQPDGTVRAAAGTSLPEQAGTGYYRASNSSVIAGDMVIVKEGAVIVGQGQYRPEVNDNTIAIFSTIGVVVTPDISFTLTSGSTDDNAYNNMVISIQQAVGGDIRERRITDYVGASRTVTVDYDFEFVITAGDTVRIYLGAYSTTAGAAAVDEIAVATADKVWDELEIDHVATGTFGKKVNKIRELDR